MKRLARVFGADDAQALVFVIAILAVLLGIGALVIDGGKWMQTQRQLQTAADAAALAGVLALPSSTSSATSFANTYVQNNYSGASAAITYPTSTSPPCGVNSCIRVVASKPAPGTLAKIYGSVFNSVNVTAKATAAVTVPSMMKNVAPMAVLNTVACTVPSCYGQTKTVNFDDSHVTSSTIGLIDLSCHSTASTACPSNAGVGAAVLKGWIESGYPNALPSGQWYNVKTGQTIGPIKQGLTDMKRLIALAATVALAVPATASAARSVQIRHVDLKSFPQVRVTVLAPAGTRPVLSENGRGAPFAKARQLGSAEALVLAIDNSESMQGRPLREAKRAAHEFLLDRARQASAFGLVAFGHEALVLTRSNELGGDVAQTLDALAPDTVPGTALYDAVVSSVGRLRHLSTGARILVLLTDGRDVGSAASLKDAISAAETAGVTVYAIAAGSRTDLETLRTLAGSTGGRVFDSADVSGLAATYASLGRELDRTWLLTYLTKSRPGDSVSVGVRAGGASAVQRLRIPGAALGTGGPLPEGLVHRGFVLFVVVALAALLFAAAAAGLVRSQRAPEIRRLLDPHVKRREQAKGKSERRALLNPLVEWAESSLEDLPGHACCCHGRR